MNRTFWAILAAPLAVFAWLVWQSPVLFLWGLAIVAVLAVLGALAALFVVACEVTAERKARVAAEEEAEELRELLEDAQRLARQALGNYERQRVLYLSLSEMHKRCPTLRMVGGGVVVPFQRPGEHDRLAMSRAEWDAIQRETEGL